MSSPRSSSDEIKAIVLDTIQRLDGPSPTELTEHFFPPSPLGFEKADLRAILSDLLHSGAVVMESDRRLRIPGDPLAPDRDCYTLSDGSCIAPECSLHGPAKYLEDAGKTPVARLRVWRKEDSVVVQTTHLIRRTSSGGTPGDTLCGLTRFPTYADDGYTLVRAPDLPSWGVEGGVFGNNVRQEPCSPCYAALNDEVPTAGEAEQ